MIKVWCILVLLFGLGSRMNGQEQVIPREILEHAEQAPEFPGGISALKKFLYKNLHYPKNAVKSNSEGQVIVRFVVETDGEISDIAVRQTLDHWCDREAVRVIQKMPKWNPARQNGAAVATYYEIPISFQLQ